MSRRIILKVLFILFSLFIVPTTINSSTTDFIKKEKAELLILKNNNKVEYAKYLAKKYSEIYDLDWKIVFSIMKVESNFNYNAKGPKGEIGLMQVTISSAKFHYNNKITEKKLFDTEINVDAGCKILRDYLNMYSGQGKELYAVATYNAGPKNVFKSYLNKKDPPNKKYVKNVAYEKFKIS